MLKHEKKAFYKFFLTYFISVALLILSAGYFYYQQTYNQLFKAEHFSVIKYARHLKSDDLVQDENFKFEVDESKIENFSMDNITLTSTHFIKRVPYQWDHGYYVIYKKRHDFDLRIEKLFFSVISFQLFLLLIFALISLRLAKNALKPMQEAIHKLDSFSKDLIHDLNTPVTAMNLNMKILQKHTSFNENKALKRIQKSLKDISELHLSLRLLLEEETFQLEEVDVCRILEEVVHIHQELYPSLKWKINCKSLSVKTNAKALKQVLHNIISNACKYNKNKGSILLVSQGTSLSISDTGIGINEPQKIFERNYTEHLSGFGIGLDIVKRLCEHLNITIEVSSSFKGTAFILTFN